MAQPVELAAYMAGSAQHDPAIATAAATLAEALKPGETAMVTTTAAGRLKVWIRGTSVAGCPKPTILAALECVTDRLTRWRATHA